MIKEADEINSQFGNSAIISCGEFNANIDVAPPHITYVPAKDLEKYFTFDEIIIKYKQKRKCISELMINIKKYIQREAPTIENRKKATIVWRVEPFIEKNKDKNIWTGYARLKVLTYNSKSENYYIKMDVKQKGKGK